MGRDTTIGELALKQKFATKKQLKACYQIRKKLQSLGIQPKPLEEILLEKGIITPQQHEYILRILEKDEIKVKIEGYEILEQIGTGGMGTVFKARQQSMDRLVALKVLPLHLAQDQEYVEKFKGEARVVAKLNHENIVSGIDIGKSEGHHYFAMEFIEGQALNELLDSNKIFTEQEAVDIVYQITKALTHAHKNNVIHCDIKPHNIMLAYNNVAKLCDLGLARQSGLKSEDSSQQAVGTPHYISPEQAKGTEAIDERSDIYSLGATLYHLVVGETPFSGSSPMVVMTKHLTDPAVPPIKRNPRVSATLNSVIMKMMAKRKEDRYQSAEELLKDLELIKEGRAQEVSAGVKTGHSSRPRSSPSSRRSSQRTKQGRNHPPSRARSFSHSNRHESVSLFIFVALVIFLVGSGVYLIVTERDTTKTTPVNNADNEKAWKLLERAADYKSKNPSDDEGFRLRLRRVMEKYPGSRAADRAEAMLDGQK